MKSSQFSVSVPYYRHCTYRFAYISHLKRKKKMFIAFPFQLDSHIIVKRIAKYKKCFTYVKKKLACSALFYLAMLGIYCKANEIQNSNADTIANCIKYFIYIIFYSSVHFSLADTPYEGGSFKMKLVLGKDYPQSPPRGKYSVNAYFL